MTGLTSNATSPSVAPKRWQLWLGRVLGALPVLMLLMSGGMKLSHAALIVEAWNKFGFPPSTLTPIGVVEVLCALLYAIPQTSVVGAVLVTAYLGGATATHVRAGEPFITPIVMGVAVWAGLYLRDQRMRALLPLRRPASSP